MIDSLIHKALQGEKTSSIPFWFMRQAGRYLPEYKELRKSTKDFLTLCYTPELAAEVTLQPIRRFDMDAAILFSDILVIPHAMGVDVRFEEGHGPRLKTTRTSDEIKSLKKDVTQHLLPITETIKKVREKLAPEKSLIGFCGAPWTVACYMVEGQGSRDYESVRSFAYSQEKLFSDIIEKIIEASFTYLSMQIDAGVDVIQIFDSWAGILSENEYTKWVIEPTVKLVSLVKKKYPNIPIIGFPRMSGAGLITYAKKTGVNAVSLDVQVPLVWAKNNISQTIQGNLDPVLLASDKDAAVKQTKKILEVLREKPFIFNLGHGMLPHTPLENVQAVCDAIRGKK